MPRRTSRTAIEQHYHAYQRGAEQRGYAFDLTIEAFEQLVAQNCIYCNMQPLKRIWYIDKYYYFNGIDRVDNTLGYTISNCVPCCSGCNRCKGTLTVEYFKKRTAIREITFSMLRDKHD